MRFDVGVLGLGRGKGMGVSFMLMMIMMMMANGDVVMRYYTIGFGSGLQHSCRERHDDIGTSRQGKSLKDGSNGINQGELIVDCSVLVWIYRDFLSDSL